MYAKGLVRARVDGLFIPIFRWTTVWELSIILEMTFIDCGLSESTVYLKPLGFAQFIRPFMYVLILF